MGGGCVKAPLASSGIRCTMGRSLTCSRWSIISSIILWPSFLSSAQFSGSSVNSPGLLLSAIRSPSYAAT